FMTARFNGGGGEEMTGCNVRFTGLHEDAEDDCNILILFVGTEAFQYFGRHTLALLPYFLFIKRLGISFAVLLFLVIVLAVHRQADGHTGKVQISILVLGHVVLFQYM